jgi:hypothetical protein
MKVMKVTNTLFDLFSDAIGTCKTGFDLSLWIRVKKIGGKLEFVRGNRSLLQSAAKIAL